MIAAYDKAKKEDLSLNAYYLAISALQKCVRRGDVERAVNFGKICWRMEPYRLFARLWTILYEDCGRDLPALRTFFRYREGYKSFEQIIPLIVAMAKANKSRDSACLSSIIRGATVIPTVFFAEIGQHPIHKRVLDFYKNWPDGEWSLYDPWDYGVGETNYDWTIELAERSTKWSREGFGVGSPYFFMRDTYRTEPTVNEVPGIGELYEDWFPMVAVDTHTRPGKMALGTYLKHREGKFGETPKDFDWWVFHLEGWRYVRSEPYEFDFTQLCFKMQSIPSGRLSTIFYEPGVQEYYDTTVLPELHKVREWVLNKMHLDMMKKFKEAYLDDWVSV